jgi:hypothetical protein
MRLNIFRSQATCMGDLCGAKTRSGTRCKKWKLIGRSKCQLHGGASPRGEQHYNWQGKGQTREMRAAAKAAAKRLRDLKKIARSLGMIR